MRLNFYLLVIISIIFVIIQNLSFDLPNTRFKSFYGANDFKVISKINYKTYILENEGNYVFYSKKREFEKGDILRFKARAFPIPHKLTPNSSDYFYNLRHKYKLLGIINAVGDIEFRQEKLGALVGFKNYLKEKISNNTENPLALALLTGDKREIDEELYEIYRKTGTAHILAISGLHIGGIAFIFFLLFKKFFSYSALLTKNYDIKKLSLIFSILIALFFLYVANFPISGKRAILFLFLIYLSIFLEVKVSNINILLVSAIILLLLDPLNLYSVSFQMSFAAMLMIGKFVSDKEFNSDSFFKKTYLYQKNIFVMSLLITIAITPISSFHFGSSSLSSPFANLFVMPLVTLIIMPLGMLSIISSIFFLDRFFFSLFDLSLDFLNLIVSKMAEYSVVTKQLEFNNYSMFLLLIAGVIYLISETRRFYYLSGALYILAIIFGVLLSKPDLLIAPNLFVANIEGEFFRPQKKLSNFDDQDLRKYYGEVEIIDKDSFKNKNLICLNKICSYQKNQKIVSIIHKNISQQEFLKFCQKSNLIVNFASNYNFCYQTPIITFWDLKRRGNMMINIDEVIKIEVI